MHKAMRSGLALLLVIAAGAVWGESPDHTNVAALIERNQSDLRFFDTCVSNLPLNDGDGQPDALRAEVIGLYREAMQHDYNSNLWFMQGKYPAAHAEMQQSQDFLQQAYEKVLRRYTETTQALLDAAAPITLRTRDQSAGYLLRSGFRDLAHARNFHTRGYNINPRYHTNQLFYYRSGIERARRAGKYALLAMIEARLPFEERDQYQLVTYDDVRTGARKNDPAMNDYNRVALTLRNMIQRNLLPDAVGTRNLAVPIKLSLLEIHQDTHARLIENRNSVWLEESARLNTDRFFSDYALPKRNSENRNTVPASDSDPIQPRTLEETKPATQPSNQEQPATGQPTSLRTPDEEDESYF